MGSLIKNNKIRLLIEYRNYHSIPINNNLCDKKMTTTIDLAALVRNLAQSIRDYPGIDGTGEYRAIIIKKTEELELEFLVRELALSIHKYPGTDRTEADRAAILELAEELDGKVKIGQKQEWKDKLMDSLGYDTGKYKVTSSLKKIPGNIMYLIDIGVEDIGIVVYKHAKILSLGADNAMKPTVEYLKSIGVKETNIGKVITTFPQILDYDIDKKFKPVVEYLKSIGMKETDIGKVVTKFSHILTYSVDTNLRLTYDFLQQYFSVTVKDIVKAPNLLSHSLKERIKPRHIFIEFRGMKGEHAVTTVLGSSDQRFCDRMRCSLSEYLDFKELYLKITG